MEKSKLKTGLALGGGGARGFVHIGILRELEDTVFKPQIITGTSIGAIIGAMYAATLDTHWIENRIQNFIKSDEYKELGLDRLGNTPQKDQSFFQMASSFVKDTIQINIANERMGILKSDRLANALKYLLPVNTFTELKMPFSCTAVDLHSGEDIIYSDGNLIDAVLASASIPGYMQPIQSGNKLLTDGGVSRPIPGKLVREMGSEFTIGVCAGLRKFTPLNDLNMVQVLGRAEQITTSRLAIECRSDVDIFLQPDTLDLFWADFSHLKTLIENGRNAVKDNFDKIQKAYNLKSGFVSRIRKMFTKPS